MKLLKESYERILQNWVETENANGKELAHALHEFTSIVVNKNDLLHDVSGAERKYCEKRCKYIEFTKINGAFCTQCGSITPF